MEPPLDLRCVGHRDGDRRSDVDDTARAPSTDVVVRPPARPLVVPVAAERDRHGPSERRGVAARPEHAVGLQDPGIADRIHEHERTAPCAERGRVARDRKRRLVVKATVPTPLGPATLGEKRAGPSSRAQHSLGNATEGHPWHCSRSRNLHVALEDGTEIVKGVDLAVDTNAKHAIMGPNGSGKSTLAYALMGHPRTRSPRATSGSTASRSSSSGPTSAPSAASSSRSSTPTRFPA